MDADGGSKKRATQIGSEHNPPKAGGAKEAVACRVSENWQHNCDRVFSEQLKPAQDNQNKSERVTKAFNQRQVRVIRAKVGADNSFDKD